MKNLLILVIALVALGWNSIASASINLNSSRSNIYRVMHPANVNVAPVLPKLDAAGAGLNEAAVKKILNDAGIRGITKIVILAPNKSSKQPTIILLTNATDEKEARLIAVSDSGVTTPKAPPVVIIKK